MSYLDTPAAGDPMELSSDMDRRLTAEEDIDIDFDLTSNYPQDREDDYMVEDIQSPTDQELSDVEALQPGNDDDMVDEGYSLEVVEENLSLRDEDLDDAGCSVVEDGVDLDAKTVPDSVIELSEKSLSHVVERQEEAEIDPLDDEGAEFCPDNSKNIMEPVLKHNSEADNGELEAGYVVNNVQAEKLPQTVKGGSSNAGRGLLIHEENLRELFLEQVNSASTTVGTQEEKKNEIILSGVQSETPIQDNKINPNPAILPDRLRLHPVIVIYQDIEMSLFPPVDEDQEHSQTYFLQDEKYAAESLGALLQACRSVLAESITATDELEIQIEDLGLYINESTLGSATTTLAQILELYVQLQYQDGLESPAPLYVLLCTKVRFLNRIDYLRAAVADGTGLSQISLLEPDDAADQELESHGRQNIGEDYSHLPSDPAQAVLIANEGVFSESTPDDDHRTSNDTQSISDNSGTNLTKQGVIAEEGTADLENATVANQLKGSIKAGPISITEANENGGSARVVHDERDNNSPMIPKVVEQVDEEPGQIAMKHKDLIDYDDDEPAQEWSTSSSTVQGDGGEVLASHQSIIAEQGCENGPTRLSEDQNWGSDSLQDRTEEAKVTHAADGSDRASNSAHGSENAACKKTNEVGKGVSQGLDRECSEAVRDPLENSFHDGLKGTAMQAESNEATKSIYIRGTNRTVSKDTDQDPNQSSQVATSHVRADPQLTGKAVEDIDEITYEDDEYNATPAEQDISPSPGSLKRVRTLDQDSEAMSGDEVQETKRIRSL